MTPDHEFGTPQVNVHKRTTQVNFTVVVGVLLFLAVGAALFFWFWRQT